jgi:hypothetical protein
MRALTCLGRLSHQGFGDRKQEHLNHLLPIAPQRLRVWRGLVESRLRNIASDPPLAHDNRPDLFWDLPEADFRNKRWVCCYRRGAAISEKRKAPAEVKHSASSNVQREGCRGSIQSGLHR